MTHDSCHMCGVQSITARGLCRSCYRWDRRHKRPRTPEELRALSYRRLLYRHEQSIAWQILRHELHA